MKYTQQEQDSTDNIVTRLRAGGSWLRFMAVARESSPKGSAHLALYSSSTVTLSPREKLHEHKTDHSPPDSARVIPLSWPAILNANAVGDS